MGVKLREVNGGTLTDAERLELARLLVKMGCRVSIGREKIGSKTRKYIEYDGGQQNEQTTG